MSTKNKISNFLIEQYRSDNKLKIKHNYLKDQFRNSKNIIKKIKRLLITTDFTLGKPVEEFQNKIIKLTKSRYCLGVGSGTDALFLSLKTLNLKANDEVIVPSFTFYASVGAIVTAGAKPRFVEVKEDLNVDPKDIIKKITKKTKAILIVHWSGKSCDMDALKKISNKYQIPIIEDACHGIRAKYKSKYLGTFGLVGCFSMHPLKNLNVWGDGGFLITNNKKTYEKLKLLRNHGLISRDKCKIYGYNSRLDTIQAIVANEQLKKIDFITNKRIQNARLYQKLLKNLKFIELINNEKHIKHVYHLFTIKVERRDALVKYLRNNSIDAKIHYSIPMHLQIASKRFGYKLGDLPFTEKICKKIVSLPVHEFIKKNQIKFVVDKIKEFYVN